MTGCHIQFNGQDRLAHIVVYGIEADTDAPEVADGAGHYPFCGQFPPSEILVPVGKVLEVFGVGFIGDKISVFIVYFGFDEVLFDAYLESKAMRVVDAISWDEEEDTEEVWKPGSGVNLSNNKNFWETE